MTTAPPLSPEPVRASVIIVNYNGGPKLFDCLGSVVPNLPADCELIVVDNASTDGSAEEVESRFPSVTVVSTPENRGYGAGNNLGADHARGEKLVFLNPDTVIESGWLEGLLEPFAQSGDAGLVTARILLMDRPNQINTCGNEVHLSGLTLCRGMGQPGESLSEAGEVNAVSGAAFAIRRDAFRALGGFDEDFFLYVEDTDLSWRARLAGWKILYAPESVVRHHYSLRITPRKVFLQERNRYQMLLKCLRWPTLVALLPTLLLAEMTTWGFVLLRDRANASNKLRAYNWILRNRAAIAAKRKETQSSRKVRDRDLLLHTSHRLDFRQVENSALSSAARLVFEPLFFLFRGLALALVWW